MPFPRQKIVIRTHLHGSDDSNPLSIYFPLLVIFVMLTKLLDSESRQFPVILITPLHETVKFVLANGALKLHANSINMFVHDINIVIFGDACELEMLLQFGLISSQHDVFFAQSN